MCRPGCFQESCEEDVGSSYTVTSSYTRSDIDSIMRTEKEIMSHVQRHIEKTTRLTLVNVFIVRKVPFDVFGSVFD